MNIDDPAALVADFLHAISERERLHDHPDVLQHFKVAYQRLVHAARFSPLPPGEGPGVREEQHSSESDHPSPSRGEIGWRENGGISLTPGPSPGGRGEKDALTSGPSPGGRGEKDQYLNALSEALAQTDSNWAFGSIATMCGVIVEHGGDPAITLEPILDRATVQLARVPEFVSMMQQHLGVEHPNRVAPGDWQTLGQAHPAHAWVIGEWFALNFVGAAAMTMLCRDLDARKCARQRADLVRAAESARSEQPYAYYLAELLGMVDDERLLVLDATRERGYRVRLTAVRNNFHLFTLLQAALLPGDARLNSLAVGIAKSERMLADVAPSEWNAAGENDTALWSFNSWTALRESEPTHWIWGEMKPTEIPSLDGERIVMLGPLDFPRSWEIAYFTPLHSALRSGVAVEETLSSEAYSAWSARIRAVAPA